MFRRRARTGTPTALWIDNGHLAIYLREMPASNVVSNFCRMAWIDMVWRGLKRRRTNDMGSYNLPWEHDPLFQKLHSLSPVFNVFNNLGNLLFAQTERLTDQRGGFWYSFATGSPA